VRIKCLCLKGFAEGNREHTPNRTRGRWIPSAAHGPLIGCMEVAIRTLKLRSIVVLVGNHELAAVIQLADRGPSAPSVHIIRRCISKAGLDAVERTPRLKVYGSANGIGTVYGR
jgi:hypothetical protein